ncbi:MAG: GNAT family N-acetyltransferase, partial [Betaproteobacteria bacterium]|nr:GNAT family N-acetyltransferase [Betaproteobacteria bacterium]
FGPVLSFGAGGEMIELIADRSLELAPLNQFLAQQMLKRSRVYPHLQQWRGAKPADLEALEHILLRVSELACALPQVVELDINPILVDQHGAIAVDARVVLSHTAIHSRPHEHLAVLPYPTRYERVWPLRDGGDYKVRPLHPEDAAKLQALVNSVSAESRYFRFASAMRELPQRLLARLSLIDYEREMALIGLVNKQSPAGNEQEQAIAVSRYVTNPDAKSCEFALLVHDDYAGRGLGTRMMQSIIEVARDRGVDQYFEITQALQDELESIEVAIFQQKDARSHISRLFHLKQQSTVLRHAALPLLEFIGKLHGGRVPPVCYAVQEYFRDVHDHLARTVMNLESLRDGITTATQMNLSLVTIDETEVTKRLAAWAAIFAASTALAGIWGMNFEHMPELAWTYGYPAALGVIGLVSGLLYRRFKKAGWL